MCLIANQTTTANFNKLKLTGKLTVYKVFKVNYTYAYYKTCTRVDSMHLSGPYQSSYKYTAGVHTAPGAAIDYSGKVHAGLHVCLTREEAESLKRSSDNYYIIELEVDIADLVAIGRFSDSGYDTPAHQDKQAVFKKINVPQSEIDRVLDAARTTHKKIHPQLYPGTRKA